MLLTPPLFFAIVGGVPVDVGCQLDHLLSAVKLFSKYSNLCDHGT